MNAIEFFTARGFSYEYPGFLKADANGRDFTVGDGSGGLDPATTTEATFSVQIMSRDGMNLENDDCVGAEAVLAYLERFKNANPKELPSPLTVAQLIELLKKQPQDAAVVMDVHEEFVDVRSVTFVPARDCPFANGAVTLQEAAE